MSYSRTTRIAGLCLVHCLATSVLLVFLASAGGLLLDPVIHEAGLFLAILFGMLLVVAAVAIWVRWDKSKHGHYFWQSAPAAVAAAAAPSTAPAVSAPAPAVPSSK